MTIKIAGLPGSMTTDQFIRFLQPFAMIHSAKIIIDPVTQKSRRFGLVELPSADAARLIQLFDGKTLATGQVLKVREHLRQPKRV